MRVVDGNLQPVGYARYSSLGAVTSLNDTPTAGVVRPRTARVATLQALSQNVRYRDDGGNPAGGSPGEGHYVVSGQSPFLYTGDLNAIRFIQDAAGAHLVVTYYA